LKPVGLGLEPICKNLQALNHTERIYKPSKWFNPTHPPSDPVSTIVVLLIRRSSGSFDALTLLMLCEFRNGFEGWIERICECVMIIWT
jgi:hypothetical protein